MSESKTMRPVTVSACAESVPPPVGAGVGVSPDQGAELDREGCHVDPAHLVRCTTADAVRAARILEPSELAALVAAHALGLGEAMARAARGGTLVEAAFAVASELGSEGGERAERRADIMRGLGEWLSGDEEVGASWLLQGGVIPARWPR